VSNEAPVDRSDVEAHLDRLLASETFRAADRSRRLLRFIVVETLEGRADRLKDYTLGAEGLGRGDDFDPRTDPIARVEASRLRTRLDVYYATEGAGEPVRILLPKGGYVPRFERLERTPPARPSEEAGAAAAEVAPASVPSGRMVRSAALLVAAAVLAVSAWAVGRRTAAPVAAEMRLEITTPPTTDPASLAIAPDGRRLAFVASNGGVPRLWLRSLASSTARPIAGTDHAAFPFWSPDGRGIGFFADARVRVVDLQTGVVRTIAAAPVPAGGAWGGEEVILHPMVPDSPLFRSSPAGGTTAVETRLLPGQTGHRGPSFLPDGRRFLFYATGRADARGVYLGELGRAEAKRIVDADAPAAFVPPGHLLYVQHGKLVAHRFDLASGILVGSPVSVAEPVAPGLGAGPTAVAASATGTIVYRTGPVGPWRQLVWFDRRGRELGRIGEPEARGPANGSISPDGRRLAVQRSTDGNTDIWLVDLGRQTSMRFTSAPPPDIAPVWSPDGGRIAYASIDGGVFEVFEKPVSGPDARRLTTTGDMKQVTDWSRDGRHLLYRRVTTAPAVDLDIWAMPLDGDRRPFPVVRTPFEERDAQFSPDGTWIAYQSNESGQYEIYAQPFGQSGDRVRISARGGVQARWRADGRELFYLTHDGELTAVPVTLAADRRSLTPGAPMPLFTARVGSVQGIALPSYAVSADGERFLFDTLVEQPAPPISVILNWAPAGS
jgi:Tol biopolymer transport system component